MEREEILKAAIKNNAKGEEYENRVSVSGNLYGSAVAILLGIILFVVELLVRGSLNTGLLAVGFVSSAVQFIYEGVKINKRLFVAIGVFQALISTMVILAFVVQVTGI